ncbi:hypothetical protein L3X38_015327 [Prunus dulcis]|uniref:Uncharacterized protein n=1 Tax=Prunus dulcis TaxID=3755 RepID=A0AAD4WPW7_PRUDU|nr:hypothetical protein L3X38_015327 [Prunus dulcis]
MAPLLQMQTLTPNLIQNQDPLLMNPTPTSTMTTTTPTPTPKTTPTATLMMTPTPNLSLIQTLIPISTSTPAPTQAQISIPIPTQPVSYASSVAQIMTSRLTTPTLGPDCAYCGDLRHTCETCFKSHGYPNWWATLTDQGQCNMTSNAVEKETDASKRDKEKSKDGEEKEEMPAEVIVETIELAKKQQEAQRTEPTSSELALFDEVEAEYSTAIP